MFCSVSSKKFKWLRTFDLDGVTPDDLKRIAGCRINLSVTRGGASLALSTGLLNAGHDVTYKVVNSREISRDFTDLAEALRKFAEQVRSRALPTALFQSDDGGPWQSVAATTAHDPVFYGPYGRYLSPDEAFNDPLVRTADGTTVWECNAVTDELDGVIIINPNNAPVFAGRTLRHALWAILERPAFLPYSGKYRIGAILGGRLSEVGFVEADEFDKITAPFKETIRTL